MVTALLLLFVVVWSDPFARIFPPAIEGRDLNPMLQHLGLILHPPLLYLGYGGLMVAAGVALASLLRGDFNAQSAWVCWRWAAARLVCADAGDNPRFLVGLLRAGLGRLVVLGPRSKMPPYYPGSPPARCCIACLSRVSVGSSATGRCCWRLSR
ncbi:heme lyase subunit NrfE [Salmonella enterica subsp. enterica]|uniref:Heme lyase subunit NrfE n=1 Tax=Salmonella enterica I TaxID=59201 RepID=A0A3S5DM57_SALET|nr:heme lyase subunit NrfE [Salmonella enterica subsp. enterica]